MKSSNNNFSNTPIDIVYLWIDGKDKNWKTKKNEYINNNGELIDKEANYECRFIDNEELKYSLRSLEKYADWINKIFIVTDNQIPQWLDLTNPRIKIIDHTEILPDNLLPCFNSVTLEYHICNIKELSEFFIYANDDMFFAKETSPEFFFSEDLYPIFRFGGKLKKKQEKRNLYTKMVKNAQYLVKKSTGKIYKNLPHHNIDAYRKSDLLEFNKIFKNELEKTLSSGFRTKDNIERVAYAYYACAIDHGHFKRNSKIEQNQNIFKQLHQYIFKKYHKDSIYLFPHKQNFEQQLKTFNPNLFCINDNEETSNQDREFIKTFFEKYFPEKSSFEK